MRIACSATALLALTLSLPIAGFAQATTVAPPPPAHQAQPWTRIPIPPLPAFHPEQPRKIVLKNGMILFLQPDHELPFINGSIVIRGGARDVPADKAGMIDLYGDAWRTSGTAAMSGDQMDDLLESKAAKIETGGDIDSTGVSWSCFKQDEGEVFKLVVDLLEHPEFREDKLKLAQQQAETSIVRRNDNAGQIARREAVKLVYGAESPYGRVPQLATVSSVTLNDLKQWHDRTVYPNNMIVGVEGDFDPAAMERELRAAFESLPRGPAIKTPAESFPGPKPGVYLADKTDIDQSQIWIVGLGTERNNPDYYALSVMNEIFSGGFGSRLFQDVRTRLGLAYAVGGAYGASFDHPGVFYVTAGTKSGSTVEAAEEMLKQIRDLKTQPFTQTELRKAKDQLLNSFIFHYDSPDKVLNQQMRLEFYGYPADFLAMYRDGIEKVTTADLERVAGKYIEPSKLAVLVVGNAQQFGTPLSKLGKVEPVDISIPGLPHPPGEPAGSPGKPAGITQGGR